MVHADGLDFLQHLEHRRTHIYTIIGQSHSIKYVHVHVFLFVLEIKDRECLPFYPTFLNIQTERGWMYLKIQITKFNRISECILFLEAHQIFFSIFDNTVISLFNNIMQISLLLSNCLVVLVELSLIIYFWKKFRLTQMIFICFNIGYVNMSNIELIYRIKKNQFCWYFLWIPGILNQIILFGRSHFVKEI